ncbi:maltose phosphorylase [Sphingobacterium nematocida]|uniref:Maltose phosphorylase n=1 Tax=Sphingobacterium nematocida TaxID=1513896 RepID=A0A1T5GRI8_9SPHI|nr:family 65 glycosyl hydrolase domain-containing protein [Sphingobacterium nematocida]SKC10950.1 maltose phosphorylase [Sphingobacterium nematocida]
MKDYIIKDEWQIIEDEFRPAFQEISESLFSIGNGRMGQRANFEEDYSGKSLQGSYIAGVYYPDKTRVGWWKNGYPEYFAKVINSVNWIGIHVYVDGEQLDLEKVKVHQFRRVLDMQKGQLIRSFEVEMNTGARIEVQAIRMYHLFQTETASLTYTVKAINRNMEIAVSSYMDADVVNRDSNYDEQFWEFEGYEIAGPSQSLTVRTKKTGFAVRADLASRFLYNNKPIINKQKIDERVKVGERVTQIVEQGAYLTVEKYVAIHSSINHPEAELSKLGTAQVEWMQDIGFSNLLRLQQESWQKIWQDADIRIEGDVSAQQAIRFNIFQLYQTYTGEDSRLNIGPKGFTGEKYGGVTYWDTEAYCLPFYMATKGKEVARNLLIYRYRQLDKAIENAEKLGFDNGAALYPMVTINGEECHNEWEITFEEIHRNAAIAFAIFNYIRFTDDRAYLATYGLEVLVAIARFWSQRVNWSEAKQAYVMLGVTGPNEYENNVNNNWYTNRMAAWCLEYTVQALEEVCGRYPDDYHRIVSKVHYKAEESEEWKHIITHMYYPIDEERGVFLQQDGFLDKDIIPAVFLSKEDRPLNQKWSWDRILRSCYIKQADVLQGLYFLEDQFDLETIRRNYDFYEPLTVHESSLSPCVHAIIAAKIGNPEKAYEFYLRTARLDLDDYNNDTEDGLHITSMAGTWMSIVEGFAGMRVKEGTLSFNPFIPQNWDSYSFNVQFRGTPLKIKIAHDEFMIENHSEREINIIFNNELTVIKPVEK